MSEGEGDTDRRVDAILAAIGGLSLVFGAVILVSPEWSAESAGYSFRTTGGKLEFMTVYGGFYLGLGLFWLAAIWERRIREGAVAALALGSAGSALVRGGGGLMLGVGTLQTVGLFVFELVFAVLGWAAWGWVRSSD